jgi:hypothetical protein
VRGKQTLPATAESRQKIQGKHCTPAELSLDRRSYCISESRVVESRRAQAMIL